MTLPSTNIDWTAPMLVAGHAHDLAIAESSSQGSAQSSPAEDCLHGLQALTTEIETAIQAIAANSLCGLEESVRRQEIICTRLAAITGLSCAELNSPLMGASDQFGETANAEDDLSRRILAAKQTILDIIQRYEALLNHSGESIQMLSVLCSSFNGQIYNRQNNNRQNKESRGPGPKQETWNCEV